MPMEWNLEGNLRLATYYRRARLMDVYQLETIPDPLRERIHYNNNNY